MHAATNRLPPTDNDKTPLGPRQTFPTHSGPARIFGIPTSIVPPEKQCD
jgi:hypothetical protein